MSNEQEKYEEWLTCITNTRLLFNSINELELYLDAPSIHSNGIKRCFFSLQRVRSAFRDLAGEIAEKTEGFINLENLMVQYKKTWKFYKDNLARRNNPYALSLELLRFSYPPYITTGIGSKKALIFQQIEEQEINVPLLVLMLMKAIPGYDSKNGDVTDINIQFTNVLDLLEKFTEGCTIYSILPCILEAKEEPNKTRLMLIHHVFQILDTYVSFSEQANIYETSNAIKENQIDLDLDGFWNDCKGQPSTSFWRIERALNKGTYFATYWKKDASNDLIGLRYTLFLIEGADNSLIAYMLHPESIKHRIRGIQYTDADHVWYKTPMPVNSSPNALLFKRMMSSSVWNNNLSLYRVTNQKTIDIYKQWTNNCPIIKPYKHLEYEFHPSLQAITQDALFIQTGNEHDFFRVPKDAFDGCEKIQLEDNVGIMNMDSKQYLAFDEFLLYIPTTKMMLKKYGITRVNKIE